MAVDRKSIDLGDPEKPGGRRLSGLFRLWLRNRRIGRFQTLFNEATDGL